MTSPTGRRPSEPEVQHMKPSEAMKEEPMSGPAFWYASGLITKEQYDYLMEVVDEKGLPVTDMQLVDFADLELRLMAMLSDPNADKSVIVVLDDPDGGGLRQMKALGVGFDYGMRGETPEPEGSYGRYLDAKTTNPILSRSTLKAQIKAQNRAERSRARSISRRAK